MSDIWDQTPEEDGNPFPPPIPEGADDSVTEDAPADLDVVTDPRGITFLSSTTLTRTERSKLSETSTTVHHVAHFAVEPGTIADQTHQYGSQVFRPLFLIAQWDDGRLDRVRATGRRVLKSGKLQGPTQLHPDADISRATEWRGRPARIYGDSSLDNLPEVVQQALTAYETAVAVESGHVR